MVQRIKNSFDFDTFLSQPLKFDFKKDNRKKYKTLMGNFECQACRILCVCHCTHKSSDN